MRDLLGRRSTTTVWEKAVFYHLVHALMMVLLASLRPFPRIAWGLFSIGILTFSGSLYVWALTGVYWLVFVTPIGGVFLLSGWLWLAIRGGGTLSPGAADVSP